MTTAQAFSLRVPENWVEFDLKHESLAELRAKLVAQVGTDKLTREGVNDLFRTARKVLDGARRRGALYAAGAFHNYDDGLLLANAMVFGVTPAPGLKMDLQDLVRQLTPAAGPDKEGAVARRVTLETIPEVGQVGRVVGIEEAPVTDQVTVKLLVMHTVIPLPDDDRVLIVTCTSPNLTLTEELLDLFDAISGTFRFRDTAPERPAEQGKGRGRGNGKGTGTGTGTGKGKGAGKPAGAGAAFLSATN
ncbi:hypothetical protein [Streptomyces sp. NPDC101150]|uniref:hypothetical protein n=1 Tax=Streptomyces sp. NPDC101150 TaxID=3366114 RepID=UPI003817DDB1